MFAITTGAVIGAVVASGGGSTTGPLVAMGVVFVALQVSAPLHQTVSESLGNRMSAWLYDDLTDSCSTPPGIGHLEDPTLAGDITVAREFDSGHHGPPMEVNLPFIAIGLIDLGTGVASAVVLAGYTWWAPLVLAGAWGATHWLLRESAIWKDRNTDEVREASLHAEYAFRLAVDPPPAKELRVFGLSDWVLDRFTERRRQLFDLQQAATRLRERSLVISVVLVSVANVGVLVALARDLSEGSVSLDRAVVYAQVAVGTVVDRLRRPQLGPRRGGGAGGRRAPAPREHRSGRCAVPGRARRRGRAARRRRSASATSRSPIPRTEREVLRGLDLTIPAGSSLAIVGQNGAGKTTLAKLLCRLYDPTAGAIEADGTDLRDLEVAEWRGRVAAVFQDFTRFELSLRDNVAPHGAPDEDVLAALVAAGADHLASLDTVLSTQYAGGIDLSGGEWQRVALARAVCAVRRGAGVVLLDEPTAQLDVRGEAQIFRRLLEATRGVTTILVSHRFSTVRHVDRICVVEDGRVVEIGSHDELMAQGGRYRTMFELQAQRFDVTADEEGVEYDVLR